MKNLAMAALACLVGACGSDESAGGLGGVYALEKANGCAVIYSFMPKVDEYGLGFYCDLESGEVGAEIENGHYTLSFGRVYFTPDRSTCADNDLAPYDVGFVVYDNGDLLLNDGRAAVEFVKISSKFTDTAGPRGAVNLLGCWDGEDFYPR